MTYENKRRFFIVVFIVLFLLLVMIFVFGRKKTIQPQINDSNVVEQSQEPDKEPNRVAPVKQKTEPTPLVLTTPFSEVRRVARVFTERFGSYSSQSNFGNIEDVLHLVSNSFALNLQKLIVDKKKGIVDNDKYYGYLTRVLSDEIISGSVEDNQVALKIRTVREKSLGSPENSQTYYQDIELYLIKEGSVWKVDSAQWKDIY